MTITADELLTALRDELRPGTTLRPRDGPFPRVVLDSRAVERGDLFVALKGERVDGHDFISDAVSRGAGGVVAHREPPPLPVPVLLVRDTLAALQRLGAWWRDRYPVEVIGVTGSVGKTSTKELVADVLSYRFPVHRSPGNLNSESGLPLALLGLGPHHRYAVLEMAMYAVGDIALLCRLARPRYGIVTTIGPVHLERLGSMARIVQAKGELVEALPKDGLAVLNADDPYVRSLAAKSAAPIVWYGQSTGATVRATDVEGHGLEGLSFRLRFGRLAQKVRTALIGRHHVSTALAAAAMALHLGMSFAEVVEALERARPALRLQPLPGKRGTTVLNDTYNASPASVKAALDLLAEVPGRHVAVLGDMRELGAMEEAGHREVGRYAAERAQALVAVGALGRLIGEEAARAGCLEVHFAPDAAAACQLLDDLLQPGDVVLVKGSRALALEQVVAHLRPDDGEAGESSPTGRGP